MCGRGEGGHAVVFWRRGESSPFFFPPSFEKRDPNEGNSGEILLSLSIISFVSSFREREREKEIGLHGRGGDLLENVSKIRTREKRRKKEREREREKEEVSPCTVGG